MALTIFEKNLIHIQNVLLIKGCLKVRTKMSVTPNRKELLLEKNKMLYGIQKPRLCSDIQFFFDLESLTFLTCM